MRSRTRLRFPSGLPQGRRLEYAARVVSVGLVLGLVAAIGVAVLKPSRFSGEAIELIGRQPTAGGWSHDRIVVNQGERVRLRIRSEDVVHGFAIGRMGVDAGPIEPGETVTVDFVANQAGEFTFYCTTWCDPNHPRMRGILEVRGQAVPETARPYSTSDILLQHLDDQRDAGVVPEATPSAARGFPLYGQRCASCHGERGEGTARAAAVGRREFLQDLRPVDVFQMMAMTKERQGSHQVGEHGRAASIASKAIPPHAQYARDWSDRERWDVVAALWSFATTGDRLDLGQRLFAKNCAACHGERGQGDGPGGKSQPKKPADFTDARRMLAGTSALYTAKIRRGGMGTGMPYWGSIFTEEELMALVNYLWTFSLSTDERIGRSEATTMK